MDNNKGWIKICRSIIQTDEYFEEKFTKTQCWIDLLLIAQWEPQRAYGHGAERITLRRGQIVVSLRQLSQRWQLAVNTVRRRLAYLVDRGRITMETQSKFSVITIVNYDKYQSREECGACTPGTLSGTHQASRIDTLDDTLNCTDHKEITPHHDDQADTLINTKHATPTDTLNKNNKNKDNTGADADACAGSPPSPEAGVCERGNVDADYFCKFFAPQNSESLNVLLKQLHAENCATLTVDDLKHLARQVLCEWQLSGATHIDYPDYARHLINHIRIKNRKSAKTHGNISHIDNPQLRKQQRDSEFAEFIAAHLAGAGMPTEVQGWA